MVLSKVTCCIGFVFRLLHVVCIDKSLKRYKGLAIDFYREQ